MKTKTMLVLATILIVGGTAFYACAGTNTPATTKGTEGTERPAAPKLTAPPTNPGRLYTDTFLSVRTPDLKALSKSYGVGVGYQVSPHWAIDARASHRGLNFDGDGVTDVGGRLVARMPFKFLSPYTFMGASFDLEEDRWSLQPGAGIEFGVNKRLRGLSVFAEGALDAKLVEGTLREPGWLFSGGLRLRF